MATIKKPFVLIELNGADPVDVACRGDVRIWTLDWDEVREGEAVVSSATLEALHDVVERELPGRKETLRSIRSVLRERGVALPSQYDDDFAPNQEG